MSSISAAASIGRSEDGDLMAQTDATEVVEMTHVTLIGEDVALLEGLAQSLAALGHLPSVARSLGEARELCAARPPLVLVADRALMSDAGADLLSVPLAAGGARVLYRTASVPLAPLLPALQRAVLADLTLPLERHRLAALIQSLSERSRMTGRATRHTPTEGRAL
jgi:DNA-binding NtrC family response regulator